MSWPPPMGGGVRASGSNAWPPPGWTQMRTAQPALPVEPRYYHHFWRTPRWRWWKPLLAVVVLGVVAFGIVQTIAVLVAAVIDLGLAGASDPQSLLSYIEGATSHTTPALFIANNVALDLLIPIAMLTAWAFTGQRPGWLSSVVRGIRWRWLLRCVLVLLPLWLVYVGLQWWAEAASPGGLGLHLRSSTWLMLVAILITTPLQSAGEEYGFRGVIGRAFGSFFTNSTLSLLAATLMSATAFTMAHAAGDPWLNVFYFSFGVVASVLAWRTGGLEACIAMHAINNLLSEAQLPFTDISNMFDRGNGTVGPGVLIGVLVPLIGLGLIEWQARKVGIIRATAPDAGAVLPGPMAQYNPMAQYHPMPQQPAWPAPSWQPPNSQSAAPPFGGQGRGQEVAGPAFGQPPAAGQPPAFGPPPVAGPAFRQPPAAGQPPAFGQPPAAGARDIGQQPSGAASGQQERWTFPDFEPPAGSGTDSDVSQGWHWTPPG